MTDIPEGMKLCRTCGEVKPFSEFNRDRHKTDGYHTMCKSCKRKYRTGDFYSARERELETRDGKWDRHYQPRNVLFPSNDGGASYKAMYHHSDRSDLPITSHNLTAEEWQFILAKQNHRCAVCGCEETEEIKLQRDCMIPLSMGGSLTYWNTQALCPSCNSHKGAKAYSGILGNRWRATWVIEPAEA